MNSRFLGVSYIFLLIACLILSGQKLVPDVGVLSMQIMMVMISLFVLSISRKTTRGSLLFIIFSAHFIMSVVIRLFYIEHWNDPLGPIPMDALDYHMDALKASRYSLSDFMNFCIEDHDLDDSGFAYILYFIYRMFGNDFGIHVALLANSVAVTMLCNYTYKIANYYISSEYSKLVIAILGTLSYSVVTSANGLKENFFTLFVVGAIYYSIRYYTIKNIGNLLMLILFSALTVLFRLAFLPMLILAIVSVRFAKYVKLNLRNVFILVLLFGVCIYIGTQLTAYLLAMRGLSENVFNDMHAMHYADSNLGGILSMIANSLFAFVGPIPSFVSTADKISYITMPNFTVFISILWGSLFIGGFIKAINRRDHVFVILSTILLNSMMVLMMSFSFNFRYRYIVFPFIMILTAYGIQNIEEKELKFHKVYIAGIMTMIFFYNVAF